MAIDFKTFVDIVPHVLNVKKPVLLRGRHGVGKSCVVYQTANELGLPVVERRASQMTEGDLIGLPSTDGNRTTFNPPDWFKQACEEPVALFLDEVDRATLEVRQGIFELTDSRKLNGHVLHPGTVVFAAVNGGEHGAQYQVGEMDPAELDRWTCFDVEPTVEDWLDWAKNNVNEVIWDYINENRNHLEHVGEFEPNKVYPSRRSWDRLSECLVNAELLGEDAKEKATTTYHLAAAFVGFEAAVHFTDFVKTYEKQVTLEDILVKGAIEKTKDFGINEHCALLEKLETKEIFKEELPKEQIDNLAKYFLTLPSEAAMKLWAAIGKGELANVQALHQTEGVAPHLVELMTGQTAAE